jgi:DNA-directed RNA polymerase specialized sigma24 family protein
VTKVCERCGSPFARRHYAGRRQPLSEFHRQRYCGQTCRLAVLNDERVAAPVAQPWREGDEERLAKQISVYRRAIWQCGLDPEDVAQEVRMSMIKRPVPEHLSDATRVWNLRNRLIDVLKRHSVVDLPNGARGTGHRFHRRMVAYVPGVTPEPGTRHPEPDPWLWRAVSRLTPSQSRVIEGLFRHERSGDELALELGVTKSAVSFLKSRGLATLKQELTCASPVM